MLDLFADEAPWQEPLAPGAVVLRRFAFRTAQSLLDDIGFVASQSPFRQMVTPGGYTMSVAMTNCGALGWTTDRHGYCYAVRDPLTDKPWPALPLSFASVCRQAAIAAGYASFQPDACLINRYAPGAKLSLHQDKDEPDLRAPIVSVSLGVPRFFSLAACVAATRSSGSYWSMAISWSGAASPGCFIMVSSRLKRAFIP